MAKEKRKKKKISTSKLILFITFLLVIEIIVYAEIEMDKLGDLSPMYALIGVVGILAPIIKHYYIKSTAENTKGGIVYDSSLETTNMDNELPNDEIVG